MKGRQNQALTEHVHPQLLADCNLLGHLSLSWVLLMDDMRYPWFVLVPDTRRVSEWYELPTQAQGQLLQECLQLSEALKPVLGADKVNIGALGNVVPQLHVHVVFRCQDDPAWPGPVWGHSPPTPWTPEALADFQQQISPHLPEDFRWI